MTWMHASSPARQLRPARWTAAARAQAGTARCAAQGGETRETVLRGCATGWAGDVTRARSLEVPHRAGLATVSHDTARNILSELYSDTKIRLCTVAVVGHPQRPGESTTAR